MCRNVIFFIYPDLSVPGYTNLQSVCLNNIFRIGKLSKRKDIVLLNFIVNFTVDLYLNHPRSMLNTNYEETDLLLADLAI